MWLYVILSIVAMALPEVQAGAKALKEKHGRAIIAGIDVAQGLSGIQLKLLAFERLLMDYPNWRNDVVMVQKCLVPNTRLADEADTLRDIRASVHRIQEKFGIEVMDYEEIQGSSSLPMVKRLVIWMAANVLLHTPIREGLNLLPLEYVYVQPVGVTIASEFSAVCSILNGALRVNPYDIPLCSITIDKALSMEFQEREGRRARDIDFVSSCPSGLWSQNVLRDLNDAMLGTNLDDGDYDDGTSHSKTVAAQKMKAVNTVDSMFSRGRYLFHNRFHFIPRARARAFVLY
jgi:trehalose 6-phosphate synthase/phosphatase